MTKKKPTPPPEKQKSQDSDALFRSMFTDDFLKDIGAKLENTNRGKQVYAATSNFRILMIDEATGREIGRISKVTSAKFNAYQKNGRGMPDGISFAIGKNIPELAALALLEPMMLKAWLERHPEIVAVMKTLPPEDEIVEWKPGTE